MWANPVLLSRLQTWEEQMVPILDVSTLRRFLLKMLVFCRQIKTCWSLSYPQWATNTSNLPSTALEQWGQYCKMLTVVFSCIRAHNRILCSQITQINAWKRSVAQSCPRLRRLPLSLLVYVGNNLGGEYQSSEWIDIPRINTQPSWAARFLELFWKVCYTPSEYNEKGMSVKIWNPFSFSILMRKVNLFGTLRHSSERHTLNKMIQYKPEMAS